MITTDNGKQTEGEIEIAKAFMPTDTSLRQLRRTVMMRLLFVALVPMIILSIYFHYQFRTTLEKRSKLQLTTIASTHAESIDRFIENKAVALSSLIESDMISLPPTKKEIGKLHKVLQSIEDTILDVGVFDDAGSQVCYSGPFEFLEGKNYRNELWFETLSVSAEPIFISDVYLGYRAQPHFIIAVRTEHQGKQWFLRMTIDPVSFLEMVDDVKQIDGAHAFIVNSKGVFQSVPEDMGKPLGSYKNWKSINKHSDIFKFAGEDEEYLVSRKKMNSVNWTLVVQQPLSSSYAPILQAQWVVLTIVVIGLAFIILASLFATASLMKSYSRSEKNRAELIEQLTQAGKMSTMGEMAAGVAHEINNPLAIMLSEIGLMEDYLDPSLPGEFDRDNFTKRLDSIREEANRSREIIHKLLGFARRTKTTMVNCDINNIIKNTVQLVQNEFTLENIEIILELEPNITEISSDEGKIKQVLLNLFMNAADAIGKYGIIRASTIDNKDSISLIVSDTGCGISKKNLQKIFMPFFSTKEVGKGTGLGLSITHGIVTSLGGKIHVVSETGKGTSFEVVLPKHS